MADTQPTTSPGAAPAVREVYFNGKPIGDAVVGGDFTFAPARADEEERPIGRPSSATFALSFLIAPSVWRRLAIGTEYASRQLNLFSDLLRTPRRRLSVADVAAARGRVHRLRGWRRRQLARLDNEVAPVAHLVKPSARRPGRRAHRRRSR